MYSLFTLLWYDTLAYVNRLRMQKIKSWHLVFFVPLIFISWFVGKIFHFFVIDYAVISAFSFILWAFPIYLFLSFIMLLIFKEGKVNNLIFSFPVDKKIIVAYTYAKKYVLCLIGGLAIFIPCILTFSLSVIQVIITLFGLFIIPFISIFLLAHYLTNMNLSKVKKLKKISSNCQLRKRSIGKSLSVAEKAKQKFLLIYYIDNYIWRFILGIFLLICLGYYVKTKSSLLSSSSLFMLLNVGLAFSVTTFGIFENESKSITFYKILPITFNKLYFSKSYSHIILDGLLVLMAMLCYYLPIKDLLPTVNFLIVAILSTSFINLVNCFCELVYFGKRESKQLFSRETFIKFWHYIGILFDICLIILVMHIGKYDYLIYFLQLILLILNMAFYLMNLYYWKHKIFS